MPWLVIDCDESLAGTKFFTEGETDGLHVVPDFGRTHDFTERCWCAPRFEEREDGRKIVIHECET